MTLYARSVHSAKSRVVKDYIGSETVRLVQIESELEATCSLSTKCSGLSCIPDAVMASDKILA